jgi:hypothetical protein
MHHFKIVTPIATAALLFLGAPAARLQAQQTALPAGVTQVCAITFTKSAKFPARVEDGALSCLEQAAKTLQQNPNVKLVLVGVSHPLYDHSEEGHGMEREGEDMTGGDIRYTDVAAYRAVNTKDYLVKWLKSDPTRILPTTDEYSLGRRVTIYTVPADASFFHNYLKTTPTNESVCTIKPCPDPREDVLTPQPRPKIGVPAKPVAAAPKAK